MLSLVQQLGVVPAGPAHSLVVSPLRTTFGMVVRRPRKQNNAVDGAKAFARSRALTISSAMSATIAAVLSEGTPDRSGAKTARMKARTSHSLEWCVMRACGEAVAA